jgi:L-2-hydroxyglutarate oxidase LhgO
MDHVETIIIGAGVVGLAIARRLTQEGHEVLILESENAPGTATSSRNSGVIHAGIYYQPGSLKARLCVAGRDMLYTYAKERGIPHKQCGKLIVATDQDQIAQLEDWQNIAKQNGVTGTRLITKSEAQSIEPEVFCTAALHVPITGIIDVHSYIQALEGDVEAAGGILVLKSRVLKGQINSEGFVLDVEGDTASQISCTHLINAAGLGAQTFAKNLQGLDASTIPSQVLAKGNYFSPPGKSPFSMLIYPLPAFGSSGLHAFCDLAGQVRFGPDVEWVDKIDYTVDPERAPAFEEAVRRYWPGLPKGVLQPDYSGIRPKLTRSGPHNSDFVIQSRIEHNIRNLINLYGIESPGLTSSLAIADYVATLLEKKNA